jgi:YrhK-like protein
MPHLFTNRPRCHDLFNKNAGLRDQFRWETINTAAYLLGGFVFAVGSVLFFPALSAYLDVGASLFIVGSLFYLLVTGHDLAEVIHYIMTRRVAETIWDKLEFWAALTYVAGTVLFIFGSVFFLSMVGLTSAGSWCFIIGSLLFIIAATINVLQSVQAKDLVTLQLMNLTAITFVTGSLLFVVASVPYLWVLTDSSDRVEVYTFLASQYLAGSVLFLIGGVFNYWKAYKTVRQQVFSGKQRR